MIKDRFTKLIKIKGVKTETLVIAGVFLFIIVYVFGLSIKNIFSVMAHNKKTSEQRVSTIEPVRSSYPPVSTRQSQAYEQESAQNPIQKVRAIFNNQVQINDSEQWYQAGEIIEGQAKIVSIEPTRVLVEWNGIESYISLDFSSVNEFQQPEAEQILAERLTQREGFEDLSPRVQLEADMEIVRAAFDAGEISEVDARSILTTYRERIGQEQKIEYDAIQESLGVAVEAGEVSKEESMSLLRDIRDHLVEQTGRVSQLQLIADEDYIRADAERQEAIRLRGFEAQ